MEHVNKGAETISIRTTLYDFEGKPRSEEEFFLAPGMQHDLVVHDMEGFSANSYGQVCSELPSTNAGDLDGRMVHYKPAALSRPGFEFMLSFPFSGGMTGTQYVSFNTFHPSLDPVDAGDMAANWIQIVNKGETAAGGTAIFYDVGGNELERRELSFPPKTRLDIPAHHLGRSIVGLVKWQPNDADMPFTVRNVRYYYDNPGFYETFDSAVELQARAPTGALVAAPFNNLDGSSILELANAAEVSLGVEVSLYDEAGSSLRTEKVFLPARASTHIIVDGIYRGQGIVTVKGERRESIIATLMEYGRTQAGGITNVRAFSLTQPLGSVLSTSYNTFLGQDCELLIVNPNSESHKATLSGSRYDGEEGIGGIELSVPAFGETNYDFCATQEQNLYGTATLQLEKNNSLIAWLIRSGVDYRVAAQLRQ